MDHWDGIERLYTEEDVERLRGTVRVNGSKNASLPLMAAALLTDNPVTLEGVPALADINNMRRLLTELGCQTTENKSRNADRDFTLHSTDEKPVGARYDIVRTMRASICVLGPLLARRGMKMGIIDAVPVDHSSRKPVTNYTWSQADNQRKALFKKHEHHSYDECFTVLATVTDTEGRL